MAAVLGPLNRVGDTVGSTLDGDGNVTTPPGFNEAYRLYTEAGRGAVPFSPEFGGGGFPWAVTGVLPEMMASARMACSPCARLAQGATGLQTHHCTPVRQVTFPTK